MCPCSMSATGLPRSMIALQKILHVRADGRGDVLLQVLLGLVFGKLLQFVGHVFVDGFAVAERREVVADHAAL